jgi:hypothetical protein
MPAGYVTRDSEEKRSDD